MTNNFDLATHPDFVRLYSLQLSQVNEMGEIRSTMNSNFMQISKQLQDMCNNSYSTEIDEIPKIPPDQTKTESSELISLPQTYYQSIINLDKPCYALSILQNPDYIPAKHTKLIYQSLMARKLNIGFIQQGDTLYLTRYLRTRNY